MNEDKKIDVRSLIKGIKANYEKRRDGIAKGRKEFWLSLGDTFEAGLQIQDNNAAMADLKSEVEKIENIKDGHTKWLHSPDRTAFDFLLVATFGYEATHGKRHSYNCACKNAMAEQKSPATAQEFADWVEEKGGILAAARTAVSRGTPKKPADVISGYVSQSARSTNGGVGDETDDPKIIPVDFAPDEAARDLGLLLVQHLADGGSRIIKTVTDPRAIASVITLIDDTPSPAKLEVIRKTAIYELNRFMLKKNGSGKAWKGEKLKPGDFQAFKNAVATLASHPLLAGKYFDGEPELDLDVGNMEIKSLNKDAHVLDPAFYIQNAKLLTLVPYGLKADTRPTKDELEKVPDYLRWKNNPPRRRSS